MSITPRRLTLATLERQLLLHRAALDPAEAVRRLGVLQAQEPASPYLALWNRLDGFDPAALDAAFAGHRLLKATLVRITLHAVHTEDHAAFHAAMASTLRASRVLDRRFTSTGLTAAEVDALVPELTAYLAEPREVDEVEQLLRDRLGERSERAWWALRTFAPVHHSPNGGPWSYRRRPPVAAAPAANDAVDPDEGVRRLLRRYLGAYGPATAQDFARFTLLRQPTVTAAVRSLDGEVVELPGPGRRRLLDLADASVPEEDVPVPPRLLGMWDSVLLAYADHGRVVPEGYRAHVTRRNGDVLPTLLVDGAVAGVWRPVDGGIEATAFAGLDEAAWEGLAVEAAALRRFLADRDPQVYGRYRHWWDKGIPAAQVRVLDGAPPPVIMQRRATRSRVRRQPPGRRGRT